MPCLDTSSAALLTVSTLAVDDVAAEDVILVYPNPVHSELNVQSLGSSADIRISDILGRTVYQSRLDGAQITINVAVLPTGVYTVLISSDKGSRTVRKFVKE
jgi:hypothetical protein